METIQFIVELIGRIIYAIVGGIISIAFVGGVIGAFAYMIYFFIRYGYKEFVKEFFPSFSNTIS